MSRGLLSGGLLPVLFGLAAAGCGGGDAGPRVALIVNKSGPGSGTVSGAGIACGETCSVSVGQGTAVTLTATPDAGSIFAGWNGCDSTSGTTCTCTMSTSETITASFQLAEPPTHALIVEKSGSGSGVVSGAGIECGGTCKASVPERTVVTLTATPDSQSTFAGWSGCDSTAGVTCTCAMNSSRTVTASFAGLPPGQFAMTVQKTGSGAGTVNGGGISCGATCSVSATAGSVVTLTAAPDAGSSFEGWSGCDATAGTTCTCTMSTSRTVTASFLDCGISSIRVEDTVAAVNGTAGLTAVVTPGSCTPALQIDWTTDGCAGAWLSPTRGTTTTFHAPAAPGMCLVRATGDLSPAVSAFAYVIVESPPIRRPMSVPVGGEPFDISGSYRSLGTGPVLIVASTRDGTITSILPEDGSILDVWYVGSSPRGAMSGDGYRAIWVTLTGEDKAARVNAYYVMPHTGLVEKFDVGSMPHGLVVTDSGVWVANYGSDTLTRLDSRSGAYLGTYDIGQWGHRPNGVAYDGNTLWVTTSDAVLNLDLSGRLLRSITPVADPYGITYDGKYVWFSNHGTNTVVRVTPYGSTATFTVGDGPLGIASAGDAIWVANSGDNTVSQVRASDGFILATLKTGLMPYDVYVAPDGGLWVSNYGDGDVHRLF